MEPAAVTEKAQHDPHGSQSLIILNIYKEFPPQAKKKQTVKREKAYAF